MSYYDNGFDRAQQLYDQQEPDYPDCPECPACEDGEFVELEPGVWGCTCGAIYYDGIDDVQRTITIRNGWEPECRGKGKDPPCYDFRVEGVADKCIECPFRGPW